MQKVTDRLQPWGRTLAEHILLATSALDIYRSAQALIEQHGGGRAG